jgi:hypothetical protein
MSRLPPLARLALVMALSPEELEQIRSVVRSEIYQSRFGMKPFAGGFKLVYVFLAVLALHAAVIGGFTVYHLLHH